MPLKLNVGLSKKIGLPDYGSLGASCHIELELEQSLVFSDLDGFHDKVRQAFVACNQAVKDELYRQQPEGGGAASCAVPGNGRGSDPCLHGQRPPREQMRPATASQIKAIVAIANRQQVDLPELLWNDYGVSAPRS